MKKLVLITVTVGFLSVMLAGCEKEEDLTQGFKIEGLTIDNFPKIDGSTSNEPLNRIIACKLLGYGYKWNIDPMLMSYYSVETDDQEAFSIIYNLVKTSQTHQAIINLIDGNVDIILSARKMSPDEKAYADAANVALIETPIALDAFIFIVNPNNPVGSLAHHQIVDIYTQQITNWNEVGGNNSAINPYIRNQNSGSQELMESLVMQGTPIAEFPVEFEISGMIPVFVYVGGEKGEKNSICYTVYYFKERMVIEEHRNTVKTIAVNGILPNRETISNRTYPFVAEVYAVIRSDLDKNSMAYKLYELLQTPAGKAVIAESGYIPN